MLPKIKHFEPSLKPVTQNHTCSWLGLGCRIDTGSDSGFLHTP